MHFGTVVLVLILFHGCALMLTSSSFVPDEYWQSLEVAHHLVYGYGYLTWEWQEGIRSYFYPCIIAIVYKALKIFQLDSVKTLIFAPRLLQAAFSCLSDALFVRLVSKRAVSGVAPSALFSVCTCWFWLFCASRTLVNTVETSLSSIALYLYPWNLDQRSGLTQGSLSFLLIIALAGIIRPTAVIPWVPLCLYNIGSSNKIVYSLIMYIFVGCFSLSILLLTDSYFYGSLTITPMNFLSVNVLEKVSDFYGSHSISWYLFNGLPTILGFHSVPFVYGIVKYYFKRTDEGQTLAIYQLLCNSILFTLAVYSLLPHKEARFILCLVPFALFISSSWLYEFLKESNRYVAALLCSTCAVASLFPLVYLGTFHQRGTLDVMKDLAHDAVANPAKTDILFLMPCHSTPLYSHLHVNVSTRFLTCDPRDIFVSKQPRDEADEFYLSPNKWLNKNVDILPSHVVLFDVLYPVVSVYFLKKNFQVFSCYHHAHFTQGRVGNSVYLLKRMISNSTEIFPSK